MKKILAIVLCLMMVMGVAAVAEAPEKADIGTISVNGAFTLKAALPEGYAIETIGVDDFGGVWMIASETPSTPVMMLAIAFDEEYADIKRMNDMTDEQLEAIVATYAEYSFDYYYTETALGTKVLVVTETGDYTDFVSFFSVYEGYCIEFVLLGGADYDAELTQDTFDMAVKFLSDLDFEPFVEEAE